MRVLITADIQIGGGASLGHGDYGPGSRFHDQEQVLHRIADIADEERVELAILVGDTFDRPSPKPWEILVVQEFISRLPATLLVMGNHDRKSLALPSVLECLRRPGVEIVDRPWGFDFDGLRVSCLPWMPLAALLTDAPVETKDRDEQNALAGAKLANTIQGLGAHVVEDGRRHILVGHWAISGGATGAGVGVEVFREPLVPFPAPLTTAGFDMVAFGHVHAVSVLSTEPPVLQLGSPLAASFGETGHHGVWLYSTDEPEMRFIAIPDRPVWTWDIPGFVESEGALIPSEPPPGTVADACIRVRYTVTEDEARRISFGRIRDDLVAGGAHKVIDRSEIMKESRARVENVGLDALAPAAAVDLWLATDGADEATAARARVLHAEFMERLA